MKQLHSNFVQLVLCLVMVSVCTGYKPFTRSIQDENSTKESDLKLSQAKIGRSVYDPKVLERFSGLTFHDSIPDEDMEEEGPQLPSHPWRGGGHEPLPLGDPSQQKVKKKHVYIMGYKDCKEVLGGQLDNDDDEDKKLIHEDEYDIENEVSCNLHPCTCMHKPSENLTELKSVGFPGVGAVPYVLGVNNHHNDFDPHDNRKEVEEEMNNEAGTNDENKFNNCNSMNSNNNLHGPNVCTDDWSIEMSLNEENGEEEVIFDHAVVDEEDFSEDQDSAFSHINNTSADGDVEDDMDEMDETDENMEGDGDHRKLSAYACRVCLPCCEFFAERAAVRAPTLPGNSNEECTTVSEGDFLFAECRTCHVRRRLPQYGVVLTCYDCAQQQADSTCRLGAYNSETSQYRVSAKFFVVTETNDSSEVAATQHSAVVDKRIIPQYEFPVPDSSGRRPAYQPAHGYFGDDTDLYPFESEDEDKVTKEKKETDLEDDLTGNNIIAKESTDKNLNTGKMLKTRNKTIRS